MMQKPVPKEVINALLWDWFTIHLAFVYKRIYLFCNYTADAFCDDRDKFSIGYITGFIECATPKI